MKVNQIEFGYYKFAADDSFDLNTLKGLVPVQEKGGSLMADYENSGAKIQITLNQELAVSVQEKEAAEEKDIKNQLANAKTMETYYRNQAAEKDKKIECLKMELDALKNDEKADENEPQAG
jgi:hypothetical protein